MLLLFKYFSLLKLVAAVSTAYLDPGSGSFILQVLVASLVGIGFALRGYWSKIVKIFRKDSLEDEVNDQDDE